MVRWLGAGLSVLWLMGCAPADEAPPAANAAETAALDALALDGPGWTGRTQAEEIIVARRRLMMETEELMKPVDTYSIGQPADASTLHAAGRTLEPMLLALPHLFPPTTNLFDGASLEQRTLALPAIWDRFAAFQTFAGMAQRAAADVATADDGEPLRAASARLRAACDTCHRAFMKPYTPPVVSDDDINFDFDSVLPN